MWQTKENIPIIAENWAENEEKIKDLKERVAFYKRENNQKDLAFWIKVLELAQAIYDKRMTNNTH